PRTEVVPVRRTRILAVGISQLLTDIVVDSLDSAMELVAATPDRAALVSKVDELHPDLVLLGMDDAELPGEATRLIETQPRLQLVGVVKGGQMFYWYERRTVRTALGQVTANELVEVIRRRSEPGDGPT